MVVNGSLKKYYNIWLCLEYMNGVMAVRYDDVLFVQFVEFEGDDRFWICDI